MASFDEVIPPGQAGKIRASVHTSALRGAVAKGITVTHDDPSQGPVALSVRANVVGSVELLPMPVLSLAPGARGSTTSRLLVRKEASESGRLAVTELKGSAPWLKVSQRPVAQSEPAADGLPDARPGDVVLSVDATGAPVGSFMESLTFKTGLPREPAVSIPVRVTVRGPLLVQPRDLILTPDPADAKRASGQLLATAREDLDPAKIVVAADAPAFSLRTEPSGRGIRVFVDWRRASGSEPTEGTISLSLAGEVVKVPVRVNLSAPANGRP